MIGLLLASAYAQDAEEKKEWTASVAEDLEVRYWMKDQRLPDPPDVAVFNYIEQVNRLNLSLTKEKWALRAQLDEVALFANRYYLDEVLYKERELLTNDLAPQFGPNIDALVNLEKVALTYDGANLDVEIGDFYAAFGRGIALNVNRNVNIDIDTSIQGIKLVAHPGAWDITAIAGQLNRQQIFQDNPNINLKPDFRHGVAGVRVDRFGLGPANLGAHGVVYDFVEEPGLEGGFNSQSGPDVAIGGAYAELLGVGGIDWYLEGDLFGYTSQRLTHGEIPYGGALYGSATFYPGDTVFLVEAKRYVNTNQVNAVLSPELYQVTIGPTLEYERAITEDSAAAVSSGNIWAGRVRMDWAAIPRKFTPYVAVGVERDLDLGGLHFNTVPETIVHPMIGFDWLPGHAAALVNVGYRRDQRDDPAAGADQQFHGDVTLNFPLLAGLSGNINVGAEHFLWGRNPLQQNDYTEVEGAFTVSRGMFAATFFTDYSSNPLINTTGNISDLVYMAGELQMKPTSNITIKAFYGAYKSGIRCSGGQCRVLPGFEGARGSVTANF